MVHTHTHTLFFSLCVCVCVCVCVSFSVQNEKHAIRVWPKPRLVLPVVPSFSLLHFAGWIRRYRFFSGFSCGQKGRNRKAVEGQDATRSGEFGNFLERKVSRHTDTHTHARARRGRIALSFVGGKVVVLRVVCVYGRAQCRSMRGQKMSRLWLRSRCSCRGFLSSADTRRGSTPTTTARSDEEPRSERCGGGGGGSAAARALAQRGEALRRKKCAGQRSQR